MSSPTLLIMAAGMGSRYGGLKQIDPVGPHGESILEYSIYDALRAGFGKVVFVIRKDIEQAFKTAIGSRFASHIPVEYAFQEIDNLPLGFSVPAGRVKKAGDGAKNFSLSAFSGPGSTKQEDGLVFHKQSTIGSRLSVPDACRHSRRPFAV